MRSVLALTLLSLSLPATAGDSPGGEVGVGLGGGLGVSGPSAKWYMTDSTALQGVVGWFSLGLGNGGGIGISADYLLEQDSFKVTEPFDLAWAYGGGVSAATWNIENVGAGVALGASGVIGLEFLFKELPIDAVIEYRPGFAVYPDFAVSVLNFSGHARYYF